MKKKDKVKNVKNNGKKKLKGWVWLVVIFVALVGLVIAGCNIFLWDKDNKAIGELVESIEKETPIEEVPADENDKKQEIINPPKETKPSDYWEFIKMPFMSVDFTELKKKNPDTVGFISLSGTNVNYPIVKGPDNDYYLNHAFDKSKNAGGWVFIDYRLSLNNLADNTIIYGHGRQNKTIFGSLKNLIDDGGKWFNNSNNYVIKLSTPTENTLWQIVSVYKIPSETYYLTYSFGSEESHQKFIETILERSKYNFNAELSTKDKLLTLSTCYNDTEKVAIHAKLIKKQAR